MSFQSYLGKTCILRSWNKHKPEKTNFDAWEEELRRHGGKIMHGSKQQYVESRDSTPLEVVSRISGNEEIEDDYYEDDSDSTELQRIAQEKERKLE